MPVAGVNAKEPDEGREDWALHFCAYAYGLTVPDSEGLRDLTAELDEVLLLAGRQPDLVPQATIENVYKQLLAHINKEGTEVTDTDPVNERQNRKRSTRRGTRRRRWRRFVHARVLDLYNKNPGLLAKKVFDGPLEFTRDTNPALEVTAIEELHNKLWGTEAPIRLDDLGNLGDPTRVIPLKAALPPITVEDVGRRISKIKEKVASDVDGVTKKHLKHRNIKALLTKMFALITVMGKLPKAWRIEPPSY